MLIISYTNISKIYLKNSQILPKKEAAVSTNEEIYEISDIITSNMEKREKYIADIKKLDTQIKEREQVD